MAQFKAGNNPADHTVAEVMEYMTSSQEMPDGEYDRIVTAERDGKARVGILSGSGLDEVAESNGDQMEQPDGTPAAGPNEAATGQYSPADNAKEVDDPQASGDAGVTAEPYRDEAPASLGPDMPQSQAEQDAHDATIANLSREEYNALPADVREGAPPVRSKPFTAAEALAEAHRRTTRWSRPRSTQTTDLS
jgi:hypothetical protein